MSSAPDVPGPLRIRPAEPGDVHLILSLIKELATFERAGERALGTPELLEQALFGADAVAETVIAELDGEPAGFALYFRTFSTWVCRPGLWLEDLYVSPAHRRGGVGRALLNHVAAVAVERGYGRLEWAALDWNAPALSFYSSLGAEQLNEWVTHRLDGEALRRVAAGTD